MRLFLLLMLVTSVSHATEMLPGSASPDGKAQIAAEAVNDETRYRVADATGEFLQRGTFPSDYWRAEQCLGASVFWRRDSAYFVIQESMSGIHESFVVARRTSRGYVDMKFDRNTIMKVSKLSWHHGAVWFGGWLPGDRMAVTMAGDLDALKGDFKCDFVLDLRHDFRVVSCKVTVTDSE